MQAREGTNSIQPTGSGDLFDNQEHHGDLRRAHTPVGLEVRPPYVGNKSN